MNLLIVTYDLRTPGWDYTPFYEAIKNNGTHWWHYLNNAWLVKTPLTEDGLASIVVRHITKNDFLPVMRVKGIGQGWLPADAWKWIREHQGSL